MTTRSINLPTAIRRLRARRTSAQVITGQITPWIFPEQIGLARSLAESKVGETMKARAATRGNSGNRLLQALARGLNTAGQVHVATRGFHPS